YRSAFDNFYALFAHPVNCIGAGFSVLDQIEKLVANEHDNPAAGGVEETAIFNGRLAAANDNHSIARLVIECFDKSGVVVHALQRAPGHIETDRFGAERQYESSRAKNLASYLDPMRIEDLRGRIQNELDIELLLALVVHDPMRSCTPAPEEINDLFDR